MTSATAMPGRSSPTSRCGSCSRAPHPFNVFIAPIHNFQNDVTSSEIDLRVVAMQTPDWILLLGAGGRFSGAASSAAWRAKAVPSWESTIASTSWARICSSAMEPRESTGKLTLYKTLSFRDSKMILKGARRRSDPRDRRAS